MAYLQSEKVEPPIASENSKCRIHSCLSGPLGVTSEYEFINISFSNFSDVFQTGGGGWHALGLSSQSGKEMPLTAKWRLTTSARNSLVVSLRSYQ